MQVREMEQDPDMMYKSMDKLVYRLKSIKANFQKTTTTNLKQEKRFVDEIDKLERNRNKLPLVLHSLLNL